MGKRKYPPLTPDDVVAIVTKHGFVWKRTTGDHAQYERLPIASDAVRRIVTIDLGTRDFSDRIIKSMIEQSGIERERFYGATKRTALKAGVPILKLSPEADD